MLSVTHEEGKIRISDQLIIVPSNPGNPCFLIPLCRFIVVVAADDDSSGRWENLLCETAC